MEWNNQDLDEIDLNIGFIKSERVSVCFSLSLSLSLFHAVFLLGAKHVLEVD